MCFVEQLAIFSYFVNTKNCKVTFLKYLHWAWLCCKKVWGKWQKLNHGLYQYFLFIFRDFWWRTTCKRVPGGPCSLLLIKTLPRTSQCVQFSVRAPKWSRHPPLRAKRNISRNRKTVKLSDKGERRGRWKLTNLSSEKLHRLGNLELELELVNCKIYL